MKGRKPVTNIKRIEGCQHTLDRMFDWCRNAACPICLTATCGMLQGNLTKIRALAVCGNPGLHGWQDCLEKKAAHPEIMLCTGCRIREIIG